MRKFTECPHCITVFTIGNNLVSKQVNDAIGITLYLSLVCASSIKVLRVKGDVFANE